jgi:NitT/TauT family transport system substrate-binding protein
MNTNFSSRTGFAGHLAAVLAVAVAFACGPAAAADPSVAGAAAAKAEPVSLRVDWLYSSYHAPFFLGVAKGWYAQSGIDLTIKEGRGSGSVVQLVGNDSDTFGFAGADAVVRGVQNRIPIVSVATIMPKNADTMFVLRTSAITRPQDLKGKTIATTPGGTSDALLPAFLAGAGLGVGDVAIVPVDAAVKTQVMLQGRADATALPSWVASRFDAVGGARGFAFADFGVQVVGYGVVAGTGTAAAKPDLVARFVAVTMRAWEYALKHPEEAVSAFENATKDKAAPEMKARNRLDIAEAFKLVKPAVPGKPFGTQSEADWDAMQKQLLEYRAIREYLPVGQYMTNRFLQ